MCVYVSHANMFMSTPSVCVCVCVCRASKTLLLDPVSDDRLHAAASGKRFDERVQTERRLEIRSQATLQRWANKERVWEVSGTHEARIQALIHSSLVAAAMLQKKKEKKEKDKDNARKAREKKKLGDKKGKTNTNKRVNRGTIPWYQQELKKRGLSTT